MYDLEWQWQFSMPSGSAGESATGPAKPEKGLSAWNSFGFVWFRGGLAW